MLCMSTSPLFSDFSVIHCTQVLLGMEEPFHYYYYYYYKIKHELPPDKALINARS